MIRQKELTPYPGNVLITRTQEDFRAAYRHRFPEDKDPEVDLDRKNGYCTWSGFSFVVYATSDSALAHELCHVIFILFSAIGMDARDSDGEAFCYMLANLLTENEKDITYHSADDVVCNDASDREGS